VLHKLDIGAPWLADHNNQVQIEKLPLLEAGLHGHLHEAFSNYEAQDLQFGESWLSNLASYALDEHDSAVVFTAQLSSDNFVACPLKLNSRTGHAHSLSTFYTSTYSPVVCSDTPEFLFAALFQHLASVERISALTLSPMDSGSPVFSLLHSALARAGWSGIHSYFCFGNWIHELDGASYRDYLAARPARVSNTVARKTRQFLDANRGQLRIIQGGEMLENAIAQFVAVYNSSWKQVEPYPDFIPHLLRLSSSRGWLRLGIASYDDKPVASQVWLVSEGTAYIFKLAYHEDFKQLSPGTVLTAFMMEYVIDKDGVSRIDYLTGDDDYKRNWMSIRRERHGIAAYNPRTLGGGSMLLGRTLKNLAKRFLGRSSIASAIQATSHRLPD
jgi:hypothetical protein